MADDLRELRSQGDDEGDFGFGDEDEGEDLGFGDSGGGDAARLFLGMTPVERMFIAIFLFMNVLVLGLALLLATNRMQF